MHVSDAKEARRRFARPTSRHLGKDMRSVPTAFYIFLVVKHSRFESSWEPISTLSVLF